MLDIWRPRVKITAGETFVDESKKTLESLAIPQEKKVDRYTSEFVTDLLNQDTHAPNRFDLEINFLAAGYFPDWKPEIRAHFSRRIRAFAIRLLIDKSEKPQNSAFETELTLAARRNALAGIRSTEEMLGVNVDVEWKFKFTSALLNKRLSYIDLAQYTVDPPFVK